MQKKNERTIWRNYNIQMKQSETGPIYKWWWKPTLFTTTFSPFPASHSLQWFQQALSEGNLSPVSRLGHILASDFWASLTNDTSPPPLDGDRRCFSWSVSSISVDSRGVVVVRDSVPSSGSRNPIHGYFLMNKLWISSQTISRKEM